MLIKEAHIEDTITVHDIMAGEPFRVQQGGSLLMVCAPRGRISNGVRSDETMVVNLDNGEAFLLPDQTPVITASAWISDPEVRQPIQIEEEPDVIEVPAQSA